MNLGNAWNHKWFLSISAAVLLGFSYAPFPFPFFTIGAFALLYRLCFLAQSGRELAYYAYPAFILWNLITTYWLMFATVAGGIAAIVANSAIMLIPLALQRRILFSSISRWMSVPLAATPWVAYEWLHLNWDLAWPWIPLANAYSTATWAVQYIEFTGYLSISFWVLCVAGWLFTAIERKKSGNYWSAVFALSAMLPILWSLIILKTFDDTPDRFVHVVIAQPNLDSYQHLGGHANAIDPLNGLFTLSDSARTEQTDVVIWPENAILGGIWEDRTTTTESMIRAKSIEWGIPIVGGASWFQFYLDEEVPSVHRLDNRERPYNVYNSAIGIYPDGTRQVYNKNKLVPIVERFPFVNQLRFLPIPGVDWGEASGYGKGIRIDLFDADGVLFPATVCYDSVFPSLVRKSVADGAGFVTVITNDGWWGDTSGHTQHYEFARLRAIETRRAVVRSANNGISGLILPDGTPHSRTTYWTRTSLELEVPVYSNQTFYVKTGEWFGWLMLILAVLGLIGVRVTNYSES